MPAGAATDAPAEIVSIIVPSARHPEQTSFCRAAGRGTSSAGVGPPELDLTALGEHVATRDGRAGDVVEQEGKRRAVGGEHLAGSTSEARPGVETSERIGREGGRIGLHRRDDAIVGAQLDRRFVVPLHVEVRVGDFVMC